MGIRADISGILAKIIRVKQRELSAGLYGCEQQRPEPSSRSLWDALAGGRAKLILECKSTSPSLGKLIDDYDPVQIATAYAPFAAAISVLCDAQFFGGSLHHLAQVRTAVNSPILAKDFFIAAEQVRAARNAGADAILLMLSVLDDELYRRLAQEAETFGMDVLCEVHDADELRRAHHLGAKIIGINNRNLGTLQTDLSVTEKLAPGVGRDCVLISESGIHSRADLVRLNTLERRPDAYLIGSVLGQASHAQHPGEEPTATRHGAIARVLRQLIFGPTKICGLTRAEDARWAFAMGATHAGLIFCQQSPRGVDVPQAREIVAAAPLCYVGVFTRADPVAMLNAANILKLSALQLHFPLEPEDTTHQAMLSRLATDLPSGVELWQVRRLVAERPVGPHLRGANDAIGRVLYEPAGAQAGGNGRAFTLPQLRALIAAGSDERLVLAGNLGLARAASLRSIFSGLIDMNSALESSPGHKDPQRVRETYARLHFSNFSDHADFDCNGSVM